MNLITSFWRNHPVWRIVKNQQRNGAKFNQHPLEPHCARQNLFLAQCDSMKTTCTIFFCFHDLFAAHGKCLGWRMWHCKPSVRLIFGFCIDGNKLSGGVILWLFLGIGYRCCFHCIGPCENNFFTRFYIIYQYWILCFILYHDGKQLYILIVFFNYSCENIF